MSQQRTLQELIDRENIRDCMMRYAQGIDRCDLPLIRSAYWPGAHDRHGDFDGPAEEFYDWVMPILTEKMARTQHLLANIRIEFLDEKTAKVETYCQNFHSIKSDPHDYDLIQGGRYLDKFEKRGDDWRVIDRVVMLDWLIENRYSHDTSKGMYGMTKMPYGRRQPSDEVYAFLGGFSAPE
jgi:hypothetical protein